MRCIMRSSYGASLFIGVLFLAACGRPATEADCTKIVDKSIELELKRMNRPADEIAKVRVETVAKMKDGIKQCVGKRITDRMMTCVDHSETPSEIDHCM